MDSRLFARQARLIFRLPNAGTAARRAARRGGSGARDLGSRVGRLLDRGESDQTVSQGVTPGQVVVATVELRIGQRIALRFQDRPQSPIVGEDQRSLEPTDLHIDA